MAKTISDSDVAGAVSKLLGESGKKVSDADRSIVAKVLADESGKALSDADRMRLVRKYLRMNDGGIARTTRTY